jgi:hypothetical protein
MGKVGRFVIDPKAGAYCQIVLDGGERSSSTTTREASRGRLTISREIVLAQGGDR